MRHIAYNTYMRWIKTQEQSLPYIENSVLSIGNFDGVHLGHQKLLQTLTESAAALGFASVVCTFKPHPREVLRPQDPMPRLFDYRDQAEMMEKWGVDLLIEEKFTKDLSLMSGEEFMDMYVMRHLRPRHLIIGYDFNFGRNRSGDHQFLRTYCQSKNIQLTIIDAVSRQGQIVSSSAIRKLLEHGDTDKAEEFLGRKYYVRGPVRFGYQRGRSLGFPTANVSPEIHLQLRCGVYFTKTYWKDKVMPSITNVGFNPTFASTDPYLKFETHIFNFNQDIYGEQIKVELHKFHRDEIKFSGIDLLKQQVHKDLETAQEYFKI